MNRSKAMLEMDHQIELLATTNEAHGMIVKATTAIQRHADQKLGLAFSTLRASLQNTDQQVVKVIPGRYTRDAGDVSTFDDTGFTVMCVIVRGGKRVSTDCGFATLKEAEEAKQAVIDITMIKASAL